MTHHDHESDNRMSQQGDAETKRPDDHESAGGTPPRTPGGLASGLQPGGTIQGKSPGASVGSLGTGGGSTGNSPSGAVKKGV